MHTRSSAVVVSSVLTLSLAVCVPAWAQQRPLEGTTACTALVDADTGVIAGEGAVTAFKKLVDGLPVGTPQADIDRAEGNLETAQANLRTFRALATDELCAAATGGGTDPNTDPSDSAVTVDSVRSQIANLRCETYNAQLAQIREDQATLDETETGTPAERGALEDELTAKKVELNYCVDSLIPGDEDVDPIGDDGSKADTSGSQVSDVPVGSAQTGA